MDHSLPLEDLSLPWCNSDAVGTGIMEAISFVTPDIEKFLVRSVAKGIARSTNRTLFLRCREFMREESNHSRWHVQFNARLVAYLGVPPPGLRVAKFALNFVAKHLPVRDRLLLVAALEHTSAVMSEGYLMRASSWTFESTSAKTLFEQHAREELAHRSVVYDLWRSQRVSGNLSRALTVLAILLVGLIYGVTSVPWIVYRKSGGRLGVTIVSIARWIGRSAFTRGIYSTVRELFAFARDDYHPDSMNLKSDLV